jgi:hypothetical protein
VDKGPDYIVNGLIALVFSLIVWKLTHSFLGWLALFVPGVTLVILGWMLILK